MILARKINSIEVINFTFIARANAAFSSQQKVFIKNANELATWDLPTNEKRNVLRGAKSP